VNRTRAIAAAGLCAIIAGGCASNGSLHPPARATYVVRPHDTLYGIAWRHNLDYRDLAKWNRIGPDSRLSIGQVLVLQPAERAPAARAPPHGSFAVTSNAQPVASSPATPTKPGLPTKPALPTQATPATPGQHLAHGRDDPRVGKPVALGAAAGSAEDEGKAGSIAEPSADGALLRWVWPTDARTAPRPVPGGGILFLGRLGQDVRAAGAGRVVYTGSGLRGYGNLIIIKHGETLLSSYAHNREILVHEGQNVAAGQVIAHMGLGPHQVSALYFEIRINGKPTDPLRYLTVAR
jgi:lipoprotein NlpD